MAKLKEGDEGAEVRKVQELLNSRGYPVDVDGDYGPQTVGAVRAFQSQNLDPQGHPLSIDGEVGPLTLWSLQHPKPPAAEPSAVDFTQMPPVEAGGSAIGRAALAVAIQELVGGAGEQGGDNRGPFVKKYLAPAGVAEGNSWCAAFASWCVLQACGGDKAKMPVAYTAGARALLAKVREKNGAHPPESGYTPQPGDLVFWWRVRADGWQGHVGFVHQVKDGFLYTIEGNHSPKVQGFSYVLSRMDHLLGFGTLA